METNLHLPKIVSLFALVLIQSLSGVALAVEIDHLHQEKAIKTTIMEEENIFNQLHRTMTSGVRQSTIANKWLDDHNLSQRRTMALYSSGQLHYRKEQKFIDELFQINFLRNTDIKQIQNKSIPYVSFGKLAIIFPLIDSQEQIVNFYALSIEKKKTEFLNQEGIYPNYPKENTTKLFIVPTILDAATMLESKVLKPTEAVIALFDGILMPQHEESIKTLKHLKEIIWLETTKI